MVIKYIQYIGRIAGIEPASSPWQREILPFDYIRIFIVLDMRFYLYRDGPDILLGIIKKKCI